MTQTDKDSPNNDLDRQQEIYSNRKNKKVKIFIDKQNK